MSHRKISEELKQQILSLVRQHYFHFGFDFSPTFAAEKLPEVHDLTVLSETLRQWMITDGLWRAKSKKQPSAHLMRERSPHAGELNGDRNNFRYGMVNGEPREYGQNVDFEVDFQQLVAEPTASIRGDIARTYFYMAQEYSVQLSSKERKLFKAWNRQDSVSTAELARMCKIAALQGNENTYVGSCNHPPPFCGSPLARQGMRY